MDPDASENVSKTTFKSFSLTTKRKQITVNAQTALSNNAHDSDNDDNEDMPKAKKSKIYSLDNGQMHTDEVKKPSKGLLVIPRVVENDWRIKLLREKEAKGALTDEDKARLALLVNDNNEVANVNISAVTINDNNTAPEDVDYSQIPMNSFGLAFLRGFGYNESEEDAKKSNLPPKPLKMRIKNLGLGATLSNTEDMENLKVGTKVVVVSGSNADEYGTIESVDSVEVTCNVKMALSQKSVTISQLLLKIVSKKEFDSQAMVLNRKGYEAEKKKIDAAVKPSVSSNSNEKGRAKSSPKQAKSIKKESPEPGNRNWAMENLRVRIISKDYKRGAFYKQKMIVIEASNRNVVLLRDENRVVHELRESEIETVIPRGDSGKVLIVTGKYKGCLGIIFARDNDRYYLWVRLVETDEEVRVHFDDACEYVGYIQAIDY